MIKLYIKQAWNMLKENRIVGILSIAGTALSVAAVMLVILVYQVSYADYAPENHRFRSLYVNAFHAEEKAGGGGNNGRMGVRVLKELLYRLKTPEAVTGFSSLQMPIGMAGQKLAEKYTVKFTDPTFWTVFDFQFVGGAPFTQADFDAALHRAVITEETSRKLFGTVNGVGHSFRMNYEDYIVCGIVKDISTAASDAYAKIWMPYTVNESLMHGNSRYYEGTTGAFSACLLAHSPADFKKIRSELNYVLAQFNTGLSSTTTDFLAGPITQWDRLMGGNGFYPVKVGSFLARRGILIVFLLVLPALNIIGITLTQFRKQRSEIGVRKAFGARFFTLAEQVFIENMLVSVIGGILGLFIAYGLLSVCKSFLISSNMDLTTNMLLKPGTFLIAFFFTLLMNLISVGLPALRAARMKIVGALKDAE